jgi:opacity protein-like surface antigen
MVSWSCVAGAEEQEAADPGTISPWYLSAGLGGYWPTTSDQLKNQSGQYSIMVGGGYRALKYLSIDVDVWDAGQRVDTPARIVPPLLGIADSRATINTSAISVVAKLGWPMDRFEPYVGAGGGLFYSKIFVTGSALGTWTSLVETDTSWGGLVLGGVNIRLSQNWAVGAEVRRVTVKANFGSVIPGDVDVGGNSVMATLRWSPTVHK